MDSRNLATLIAPNILHRVSDNVSLLSCVSNYSEIWTSQVPFTTCQGYVEPSADFTSLGYCCTEESCGAPHIYFAGEKLTFGI